MTADQDDPARAEAEGRALFDDSLKRLRESGVIEILTEELKRRPGYRIEVRDSYEKRVQRPEASVIVFGPPDARLHENEADITEYRRQRGLTLYADIDQLANPGISVDFWNTDEKTNINKADGSTIYLPQGELVHSLRIHSWNKEVMLHQDLEALTII